MNPGDYVILTIGNIWIKGIIVVWTDKEAVMLVSNSIYNNEEHRTLMGYHTGDIQHIRNNLKFHVKKIGLLK